MLDVDLVGLDSYGSSKRPQTAERRCKPRIEDSFAATICGVDSVGLPFHVDCELDNLSCSGLYVRTLPNYVVAAK